MSDHVLVTGAMGCIGAWVTKLLVEDGTRVTTFDLSTDDRRLHLLMAEDQLRQVELVRGDVTDRDQVASAVAGKSHVIHLAALQIPFCKADPSLGAAVNVTGTVNVFEAVKTHGVQHLAFASSVAVYGLPSKYANPVLPPDVPRLPETLYGVYKVANEDTAKVYWNDHGVASIGIRPHTVFGPGRDQGVTAQPTLAIRAAVHGEPYHITYGGRAGFMYVRDVASVFIEAARADPHGSDTFSILGDVAPVSEFVALIEEVTGNATVTYGEDPLPLPDGTEDGLLQRRLGSVPHTLSTDAIAETATFFAELEL